MATGLGVTMWAGPLPFGNGFDDQNAAGVSNCLIFPLANNAPIIGIADREYHVTDITLHNTGIAANRAMFAITAAGVVTSINDKVFSVSLDPGQFFVWSGKIPLLRGYGLIAFGEFNIADECIYGAVVGEATD